MVLGVFCFVLLWGFSFVSFFVSVGFVGFFCCCFFVCFVLCVCLVFWLVFVGFLLGFFGFF